MIPKKIIVHHSATSDGRTFSWSAIKRYHMTPESQGGPKGGPWLDIGYHAGVELVDDDFFGIFGRPWSMNGAHTVGQNSWALGLCIVGNFDIVEPDDDALIEAAKIASLWRRLYDIPLSEIHRHSEYENKTCPGTMFPWQKFLGMC